MNWKKLGFLDVFNDVTGGNYKFQTNDYLNEGSLAIVDQGKDLIAGYVNQLDKSVKTPTPVIVFGDHTRALKYIDFPFALGADGTKVLKPKIEADTKFLYYHLSTIPIPATGYNRHYKYLKEAQLNIPPLPTQQRIAAILDKADELRKKDKQLLAKYDALLQSVFYDMFGDPVTNERGWKKFNGDEYSTKISVGVVIQPASHYVENGIIALRSLNIRPNEIVLKNLVYFSKESHLNILSKSILKEGDVVLVRTGATGTAAIIPAELDGCNCIDLIIVKPNTDLIHPFYLSFFFNSDFAQKVVSGKQVGGIQKHFNIGAIKDLKIPLPPITLQNKFAIIAQNIQQQKQQVKQQMEQSEKLFQGLLQKAFNGELIKE